MGGQGLAAFAGGLTQSLFGGLLQDRQDEQKRKDQELVRQLAAYHALLEHPDTPEAEIPNILDSIADSLKVGPKFKPITDHMREGMQRQVPYGPEAETTQSMVDRSVAKSAPTEPATTALATQPNYGVSTTPGYTPPAAEAPATVSTPALRVVPPEPVMTQPMRTYGELSQGEAKVYLQGETYRTQQGAMLERQSKLAEAAGDRLALRDIQRQQDELERITKRAEEVRKTQTQLFENKIKILPVELQAKARLRVAQIEATLDPRLPEEERARQARNIASSEIEVAVEQKKQQMEESKARMARMKIENAKDVEQIKIIQGKGTGIAQGMSAANAREFGVRTETLRAELASTMQLLEAAYKVAGGAPVGSQKWEIDRLEAKKLDLWTKVDDVRSAILSRAGSGSRVPSAPLSGQPRGPSRYNVPLDKYGLTP